MQRILIFLSFWILVFTSPSTAQFVHVQGKEIVDAGGSPILLRGVGLGGWLVPEGYMLHIPGYGSPTSIRNRIVDLIGPNDTAEFYRRYRSNYVNQGDIQKIASWGFNSIRLPFCYHLLSPKDQPGIFLEEGFAIIDTLIEWCRQSDLLVILDMHCAPGGQNHLNISDSDGEARLWTEPENQDRTVDIWVEIAGRYAGETMIAGYDLLNEPVLPAGFTNLDLRNFYRRLSLAIREVDANHILFIEGNQFATDFTDLAPPLLFGTNVAYSFHKYWSETTRATISQVLNLRDRWNVPLWMGEAGENSNPWFFETVRLFEQENIGWCWWTHKKIQTITSPYSSPITASYQRVLDYWAGTASRPSPDFARDALFEMAENLAFEKCDFREGVLRALFDPDYDKRLQPFSQHQIPGTINCVEYDYGHAGLAYHDSDYKKVRFDIAQPWNSGYNYRNDGVDIERSQDAQGPTYSIGWIADNEWLKYTVTVSRAGLYDLAIRVASPNGGGAIRLIMDDRVLANSISVPSTGGWYDWETVQVRDLALAAGEQVLTIFVLRSGFNLSKLEFTFKSSTSVKDAAGRIKGFGLRQNHPNPFFLSSPGNTSSAGQMTEIKYSLDQPSLITVEIYNLLGQRVATLAKDWQSAGDHSIQWRGQTESGALVKPGVYAYTLESDQGRLTRKLLVLP